MASRLRLQKELKDIKNFPPGNCSAGLTDENNINHWQATIHGPEDTPFHSGLFKLDMKFPHNYPFSAPKVKFITKIYHPNINSAGEICLDILKDNWSPVTTVSHLLLSICSLLSDPNPDDPLDPDAANLYKTDRVAYDARVKQYVENYA